jgi:hypothetical protein
VGSRRPEALVTDVVKLVFEGDAKDAVRAADDTKRSLGGIDDSAKKSGGSMRVMGLAAAGALGGLAIVAKIGFGELAEGQKVAAQTEAALKSTGSAAGITGDQIGDLATSISNMAGIDDEAIQSGENLLLTFTNIRNEVGQGNDIFNQATLAITDMSVALGQDMKSSAIQLGKALNDPIKGVTALSRVGVSFTAQQKEQIKAMVDAGNTMGAQKLILGELNREFAGSAKAAGETLPGQLAKARVQFENMAGSLVEALLPALVAFAGVATTVFGFLSTHTTTMKILVAAFAALAITMGVVSVATTVWAAAQAVATAATSAWTAVQWLLNAALDANPIGIVVVAIAALVAALILAWQHSATFRAIVTGAFDAVRGAAEFVLNFFRSNWPIIVTLISGPFAPIVFLATDAFGVRSALVGAFNFVLDFVRNHWREIVTLISGPFFPLIALATDAFGIRSALVGAFVAIKDRVGEIIGALVGFFVDLPGRIANTLGALADQALNPMRALFNRIADAIAGIRNGIEWLRDNAGKVIGKVVDVLEGPLGVLGAAFERISSALFSIKRLIDYVIDKAGEIASALGKIAGAVGGTLGKIGGLIPHAAGGSVSPGQAYLVGERGPEVFLPSTSGTIVPNSAIGSPRAASAGAGGGLTLYVAGDFIGDRVWVDRLAEAIAPKLGSVAMYEARV